MKKLVYIAGPYGYFRPDGTPDGRKISAHIKEAKRVAVALANEGIEFFCPHTHTEHFEVWANAPEEFYKELDMHFLSFCDAIVMIKGWKLSKGAMREWNWMCENSRQVFYMDSLAGELTTLTKIKRWYNDPNTD